MARLSAPRRGTFTLGFLLAALGVALRLLGGAGSAVADVAFWLVTAGVVVLVFGVVFTRI